MKNIDEIYASTLRFLQRAVEQAEPDLCDPSNSVAPTAMSWRIDVCVSTVGRYDAKTLPDTLKTY